MNAHVVRQNEREVLGGAASAHLWPGAERGEYWRPIALDTALLRAHRGIPTSQRIAPVYRVPPETLFGR